MMTCSRHIILYLVAINIVFLFKQAGAGPFSIADSLVLAYLDSANMLTQQFPDLQSETNIAYNFSETWLGMNQEMLVEKRLKWLFAIIAVLSFTVIYLFAQKFLKSKRTGKKLEEKSKIISIQKQQIERTNQILEQKLLRTQLNPHFVFNALSSIQYLISRGENTEALGYLSRFSKLLRQVLDTSAEITILLAEEINMLQAYIELEALRFGDSFHFSIYVDPELDPYHHEVPALLLQPVIENAIIHGLMPVKGKRFLKIEFHHAEKEIICIVEDNGIGRRNALKLKNEHTIKHKSHGLNITAHRINNKGSKYTLEDALSYTDLQDAEGNPSGTRVKVSIPAYI